MSESESNQRHVLFTFVAGMLLTVCVAVLVVFIASQRPRVVVAPAGTDNAPAAGAPTPASPVASAENNLPEEPAPLAVARVSALPAQADPFDARWDGVPAMKVPVMPQVIIQPTLETASIQDVELKAVHDGSTIAWRIAWDAPQPAMQVETSQFADAAALQFPMAENASFMMGSSNQPVRILHWKAVWQHDVDQGRADVQDLYPNTWYDLYWFAREGRPYKATDIFANDQAKPWFIAQQAGNPMAQLDRRVPAEEAVARGYGSLTTLPQSRTMARGAWRDGRWAVVFFRPIGAGDDLSQLLSPGRKSSIALAVWNGSQQNVGSRKHHSVWVPVEIKP